MQADGRAFVSAGFPHGVPGLADQVVFFPAGNRNPFAKEFIVFCPADFQGIMQKGHFQERQFQIVVSVVSFAQDLQSDIDFGRREKNHGRFFVDSSEQAIRDSADCLFR